MVPGCAFQPNGDNTFMGGGITVLNVGSFLLAPLPFSSSKILEERADKPGSKGLFILCMCFTKCLASSTPDK